MLKTNFKKLIAAICIMVIILPYASDVLAVSLNHEQETILLETSRVREGGEESSGTLSDTYKDEYDTNPYTYRIKETIVQKIIQSKTTDFMDALYCVNADKSFPGSDALTYYNKGDFKDSSNSNVKALGLSDEDYKALIWLVDNMYLRHQEPSYKDEFLANAFAETIENEKNSIPPTTVDLIKSKITDDDIDVVQQWAIWYFTNRSTEKFASFGSVSIEGLDVATLEEVSGSYLDVTKSSIRQTYAETLYNYLVKSAIASTKETTETATVSYPSIAVANTDIKSEVDGKYYKVGPFKVNSGNVNSSSYTINLTNGESTLDTSKYSILIEGENEFTTKKVDEIFDQNYYIYLPIENNEISRVSLSLSYSKYETKASLWETKEAKYQPVILITKENTPVNEVVYKDVDQKTADLALKKYIISVNGTEVHRSNNDSVNQPVVNANNLVSGKTDAEYYVEKSPVEVSSGDKVIYEIRVYNEGQISGSASQIVDYLPEGLTLAEDSEINQKYKWQKSANGRVISTTILADVVIPAFDAEKNTITSTYVQVECIVGSADSGKVLTNVAEITADDITDRDSTPGSIKQEDINTETYTGNKENKTDLTDKNYNYKGLEDDDDFEKLVIKGGTFDLALKKFITKINSEAPTTSREPVVNVQPLKDGSKDATYTQTKTPLTVKKGDIVVYTLRVYNEGTNAGYAEEVADYLPEGLGFLVNYTLNVDNYWAIPTNGTTVKLSSIENGTANLSKDDFTGITDLNQVEVITGKNIKLTSTKLKSNSTDTKNLINGFDTESGTKLDYKDIQVACIVLADEVTNSNLKNIAEITKISDENGEDVKDRDSTPDSVNPDNYPGDDKNQDDNDYEDLTIEKVKNFDLALQKFITGLNSTAITNRVPTITKNDDGTLRYNHSTEALSVANNDVVVYTIRVYNEGERAGYAAEVSDNIPSGLIFLTDNAVNTKYGWKMYDKNGDVTTDINQAVSVKTDYLSKEKSEARGENNLLLAYDSSKAISTTSESANPDYRDVQIAFKVNESVFTGTENRQIINIAEITDDQDENGKPVEDIDSTPGNNKDGEDDIDKEKLYVKYFDLALEKVLEKIIITEDGTTREINATSPDQLLKVEINRKKINSTVVKFVYKITITNEGEIEGYAKEIKDYIPDGLKFVAEDNKTWTQIENKVITTNELENTLLQPGEKASVSVTLQWENSDSNLGQKVNTAEISKDYNDNGSSDIDSTPDNKVAGEDDIDTAPVILSISTGSEQRYIVLPTAVMVILATGIVLIKKYVL
jgi:uncharacterized repeat protein (TIGR01451 family)